MKRLVPVAAAVVLAACSHTYSLPVEPAFAVSDRTASVFVDRDGSLYPADWRTAYPDAEAQASLRRALQPFQVPAFEARQPQMLDEVARSTDGENRVFILIH